MSDAPFEKRDMSHKLTVEKGERAKDLRWWTKEEFARAGYVLTFSLQRCTCWISLRCTHFLIAPRGDECLHTHDKWDSFRIW